MNAKQKTVSSHPQGLSAESANAYVCDRKIVKSSVKPLVAKTEAKSRKRHFDFVGLAG